MYIYVRNVNARIITIDQCNRCERCCHNSIHYIIHVITPITIAVYHIVQQRNGTRSADRVFVFIDDLKSGTLRNMETNPRINLRSEAINSINVCLPKVKETFTVAVFKAIIS